MLTKDKIGVVLVKYGESKIGINEAIESILAAMPEPIGALAARKGCYIRRIIQYPDRWVINLDAHRDIPINDIGKLYKPYVYPTYAQAEQAAREYLEALPNLKK